MNVGARVYGYGAFLILKCINMGSQVYVFGRMVYEYGSSYVSTVSS